MKKNFDALDQECQTRGLLGAHEVFKLEVTTSLGNDLCNVALSKVDLQIKRSSPFQHLLAIALIRATNRVLLLHQVKLSPNKQKSVPLKCGL